MVTKWFTFVWTKWMVVGCGLCKIWCWCKTSNRNHGNGNQKKQIGPMLLKSWELKTWWHPLFLASNITITKPKINFMKISWRDLPIHQLRGRVASGVAHCLQQFLLQCYVHRKPENCGTNRLQLSNLMCHSGRRFGAGFEWVLVNTVLVSVF